MAPANKKPITREITFFSDNLALKGTLHLPAVRHRAPVVIGSHGLFSSRSSPKQIALARRCSRLGIAYFRFDHRGCGDSQGHFSKVTSLEARCKDLISAVTTLKAAPEIGDALGLFGSSMGGAVCLQTAAMIPVNVMVIFAAPVRSRSISDRAEKIGEIRSPNHEFADVEYQFDIADQLAGLKNILILHGTADQVVPVSDAREIFEKVGPPKKLVLQPGGDHLMSSRQDQNNFLRQAAQWLKVGLTRVAR